MTLHCKCIPMHLTHPQKMVRQLQPSVQTPHATIRINYKQTNLDLLPFQCRPGCCSFQQMAPLCLCFDHVSQISQLKATLFICKHTHVDLRDQHQNGPRGGGLILLLGLTFVGCYNIFAGINLQCCSQIRCCCKIIVNISSGGGGAVGLILMMFIHSTERQEKLKKNSMSAEYPYTIAIIFCLHNCHYFLPKISCSKMKYATV